MNKFDLINKVLVSALKNKEVLIELIMRADEDGFSYVGVERLSQVRGIKHTKNYPWQELHAMSDVLTVKLGRDLSKDEVENIESADAVVYGDKNYFWIRESGILSLPAFEVTKSKKPKSSERTKNPALAEPSTLHLQTKTPAVAGYLNPGVAGCNSTTDTTNNSSSKKMDAPVLADAHTVPWTLLSNEVLGELEESFSCLIKDDNVPVLQEGITYFLNNEGVTRLDDSANEEWIPTTPPKKVRKQTRLRDKSAVTVKKAVQEKRQNHDSHLASLINRNRLTEAQAQQARDWVADTTWESQKKPAQRVALAVMKASDIKEVA